MTTNGTKRRKLAHDASDDEAQSRKAQKDFFKSAASWDLEDDYASRRRKSKKANKESTKLPIKTADGRLEILRELEQEEDLVSVESDAEWLEGREDDAESEAEEEEEAQEAPTVSEAQQIREAQEELAKLALALNENPEEHIGSLKALAAFGESKIPAIRMLALMTQMSVYKDIIPGYRIRPQTEDGPAEKVSKEVRTMRQFEQALVSGYQNYVKELARCAKEESAPVVKGGQSIAGIAVTCACTLIAAVPHFNFRSDLLRILVNKLSRKRIDSNGTKCLQALETLFREDEDGKPTLEAVSLLSKMMKARDYEVDESVLNLFLSLRLLSEFAGKASQDSVERPEANKMQKKKREFRTKRQRKAIKEQKSLEKDMAAADALVDHEERDKMQSETLKLVFATYFRILKMRAPRLMGALPDKSCQAALGLLNDIAATHGKKIASLWNTEERKGDGRHNPLSDTIEGSNPFAATVWEGELLKKHFSPKVREGVKLLEKSLP
ncbi:NOC3p-domain-containing protein [Trichoderma longibrachiatum ATCC 18648]|uniref:NOC3p-domain-containing protein n=1 Tax=Trichoderma longibrachiatum ATCC 18648 TaxID=983965 RepID=A0A2T4BXY5_TRILO|nr:NOC3p-domain-containing protein [Trichoderma longibrachiatum ATCC 18648]